MDISKIRYQANLESEWLKQHDFDLGTFPINHSEHFDFTEDDFNLFLAEYDVPNCEAKKVSPVTMRFYKNGNPFMDALRLTDGRFECSFNRNVATIESNELRDICSLLNNVRRD